MHEYAEDVERLQQLLDAGHETAGGHHAAIHSPEVRLTAEELVARLPGMQVFVVATVSSDGRPFTAPVDTFLLRGRWWFGTSERALRARHLARRPGISATRVEDEALVVTMHGRAVPVDLTRADGLDLAAHLTRHYGSQWAEWGLTCPYFEIEPTRLFAADMSRRAVT